MSVCIQAIPLKVMVLKFRYLACRKLKNNFKSTVSALFDIRKWSKLLKAQLTMGLVF